MKVRVRLEPALLEKSRYLRRLLSHDTSFLLTRRIPGTRTNEATQSSPCRPRPKGTSSGPDGRVRYAPSRREGDYNNPRRTTPYSRRQKTCIAAFQFPSYLVPFAHEVDHIKIFFPDDNSLTSPYGSIEPGVEDDLSNLYGYDGRASASLSDKGLRPFVTELRSHSNELVYLASKRDHG